MTFDADIEFRNMDWSEAVEADIRRRLAKLDRFAQDVMRCKVVVEAPHRHHGKGNPERDFGRIAAADGRLVYFHRNSLIDAALEALDVGTEVRFDEEPGDDGPQATTVRLVGKHHIVG